MPSWSAEFTSAGLDVWVTVTNPDEAAVARDAGADALVVQGFEAGGHRGYFADSARAEDWDCWRRCGWSRGGSTCP